LVNTIIGQKTTYAFKPYRPDETMVPVIQVTPDDGYYIHTFYDVCPFSPSGRYLAVTRIPFQDRGPVLGETADVCIIDLEGESITTVYTTLGWGMQLGANLEWGLADRYLYTNDIIDGEAVCVRIDLEALETKAYVGPKYDLAPDESSVIGFPLDLINATQEGYGVPLSRFLPVGAATDQGLWRTDLATNTKSLVVTIADLYDQMADPAAVDGLALYLFHSKHNPQGTRIMQVFRGIVPGTTHRKASVFTLDMDGGDIKQAIATAQWDPGGHHPNWHPDGEHLVMNLKPDGENMRFVTYRYDGSDLTVLSERHMGTGHPSIDSSERYLVTDCYAHEPMALESGETPIRLLDLTTDQHEPLCYINTMGVSGLTRVDPHPAWSGDYRRISFNGAPRNQRQVFVADVSSLF
jgi:hypothetical protein